MQIKKKSTQQRVWLSLSLGLLISPNALAVSFINDTDWRACKVETYSDPLFISPDDVMPGYTYIEANNALLRDEGTSKLRGNVKIAKDDQRFFADHVDYDRNTEQAVLKGNVVVNANGMEIKTDHAEFDLNNENGVLDDVQYQFVNAEGNNDGQGESQKVERFGKEKTLLTKATYTTCPVDEKPSWHLTSSKIKFNHEKEWASAKNVTLKVGKNLPIFYFPYLSFPTSDKRKSGFLIPSYKNSSKSGFGFAIPYYFNIAPNYDYTLTPVYREKRGIALENEFRYLTENHAGEIRYDFMFGDDLRNGDNRYYYDILHYSQINEKTRLTVDVEGVSDKNYFEDLSDSLATSSRTRLDREISLETTGDNWQLSAEIEDYQVLDSNSNPYSRMPEIRFEYRPFSSFDYFDTEIQSELVHFYRRNNTDNRVTGTRFDFDITLSKEFSNLAYFVKPQLKLRQTNYSLDLHGATGNDTPSRTLPSFSVNSGIFLERNIDNGKRIQTLEPQLFYTYTPYTNQSDIPVFDSGENDFRYDQLFSINRFSGKDRIGDSNRISAALTSRIIEDDGDERFRISAGQIFHLDDREVTLPGGSAKTNSRSELALEFEGQLTQNTEITSTSLWDAKTYTPIINQVAFEYEDDKDRKLESRYRYRENSLEQLDLEVSMPIKDNWSVSAEWNHDIANSRTLENALGLEYKNCCVKTSVIGRNYLTSDNKTYDNAIFVEVAFKGLGGFSFSPSELTTGNTEN